MKRPSLYIIPLLLGLLLYIPSPLAARQPAGKKTAIKQGTTTKPARVHDIHHIAFWGGAGYSGLLNTYPAATNGIGYTGDFSRSFVGGGGGLIGIGYEYKYKHFLLSVGPEFRLFSSLDHLTLSAPYTALLNEYRQEKNYRFSNLRENQLVGQLMLPLLFGGTFDMVYFKAGAKIGYTLLGNYHQQGLLTTTLTDPESYDPEWSNLPSHGAENDIPYSAQGKNAFGLDVAVSAEVGVNIDQLLGKDWIDKNEKRERPIRMRVALFADYGLLNMNISSSSQALASVSESAITTTSLHQSEWAAGRLNSLLVGVKFTAMLQMNKEKKLVKEKPSLHIYTSDYQTGQALGNSQLTIAQDGTKKPRKRTTNAKGFTKVGLAEGTYTIHATHSGYLPSDTVRVQHTEDAERVDISLRPIPVYAICLQDSKTLAYVAADLQFVASDSETPIAHSKTDTLSGATKIALPIGHTYRLHIEARGYYPCDTLITDLAACDTVRLQAMKHAIILQHIYFATNETTILPTSEEGLHDLYTLLVENPDIRIRLIGHTDNVGNDNDNQALSEGRANSVKQNMVERGIDPARIDTEGRGKREPIASNDTEEGRAKNRRVELIIIRNNP